MKNLKLLSLAICILTLVTIFCSCRNNGNDTEHPTSPLAEEDYDKHKSSLGYTLRYDDVLFELTEDKEKKTEKFTLKNSVDNATYLLVTQYKDSKADDVVSQVKKDYESNGYTDISINQTSLGSTEAVSVTAVKKDGSVTVECFVVQSGNNALTFEMNIGSSMNDVNGEMALYAMLGTFEVE